jgi:hypothetical protein
MTLAPRFLINFWVGFRVARFARRLKAEGRGLEAQQAAFTRLMAQSAMTEFGRTHELQDETTYGQFQDTVPLQTYQSLEPLIARIVAGEADVLVPGKCPFFVETAGTGGLMPKLLPVPEAMLTHFCSALRDALFHYVHRVGHAGVFLGRHLHVGASTAVTESKGSYRTSLDGILTLCLSPWVEANLRSPPALIAQLPESSEKIIATTRAMLRRDVTLVGGTPALICDLALAAYESSVDQPPAHLQALWPNLECYLHTGAPLGIYSEALRAALGPSVKFHEVYIAAEGIFATQDDGTPTAMRLMVDAGIFYEFLPLALYNEATLAHSGALCVPLEKIQVATDYVLIVTTPAGLCRYVTDDIVRFVSVDPPRLQFAGRASCQLNAFGERVSERDIFETVRAVCSHNGWQAIAFHVAPYAQRIAAGQVANVHEWWLELATHTVKTPTANVLGPEFDAQLFHRNADYAARRENGTLGAPQVRLVIPGVFARWAEEQRKTASASKLPRCRSDRLIADQLAALTRFHQDQLTPSRTNAPF